MHIDRRILGTACVCAALTAQPAEVSEPTAEVSKPTAEVSKPTVEIVTNMGSMTVELWPEKAPKTVDNFLKLVDDGFYNGTIFHRVIAGFMIQGGGHEADMTRRVAPRTVVNESVNGASNLRWTVAMARLSDPDSAGAQFYINVEDNVRLDAQEGQPGYTVFGQLIAGQDVAKAIEQSETGVVEGRPDVPLEPTVIQAMHRLGVDDVDDQPTL